MLIPSAPQDLKVSFEFFPPKSAEMEEALWRSIKRLEPLGPQFVSVTYGAGGSTRERTHNTVRRIVKETTLQPAAHLTCVAATQGELDQVADAYWGAGVRHIVALRGDPPGGQERYTPHPGGYAWTVDLIEGLRRLHDFEITVACFPEVHPEALSAEADLDNLKRKIDAGATRAITQFFFDNDVYLRFVDRARAAGIHIPILPGIMPVTNFRMMGVFAAKAGASVPAWLGTLFDGLDDDAETRKLVAATVCAEQVRKLEEAGVREFHFYTLNRADLSYAICHILGVRPAAVAAGSAA
ncbi:MAG: methylenetetrahydrofolate reductase [Gemmatimonadales bacterium]|nr:methylenetetrahydrofolate reductase [Gemmatimonadales bacterium]